MMNGRDELAGIGKKMTMMAHRTTQKDRKRRGRKREHKSTR